MPKQNKADECKRDKNTLGTQDTATILAAGQLFVFPIAFVY